MSISATHKLLIPFIGDPLLADKNAIGSKIRQNGIAAAIDKVNWQEYPYHPVVHFYAGYSVDYLWLHYEVKDDFFRVKATIDQEAVWEDACVEFFISTGMPVDVKMPMIEEIIYRNFEFNALGICLSACGTKMHRFFLSNEEMNRILRFPGMDKQNLTKEGDKINWELSVAIPLDMLRLKPGSSFQANLYKCGDLTRQPHFLSWSAIESESPDFHLPQFFGAMELVI